MLKVKDRVAAARTIHGSQGHEIPQGAPGVVISAVGTDFRVYRVDFTETRLAQHRRIVSDLTEDDLEPAEGKKP